LTWVSTVASAEETVQAKAVRAMQKALKEGDYKAFYRDWCHPHLQEQLTADEFDAASEDVKDCLA